MSRHGSISDDPELSRILLPKISIHKGSVTDLQVDAVVNAANGNLQAGSGVCGAIFKVAGYGPLQNECDQITNKQGPVLAGQTVITKGYNLNAKYILHTVGPRTEDNKALISCYRTCLDLCISCGIRSVAFPCVSTGIFGFGKESACPLALHTVRKWLADARKTSYVKPRYNISNLNINKEYLRNDGNDDDDRKEDDVNEDLLGDYDNPSTVFDQIDSIIFCCYDRDNWILYKDYVKIIFPSHMPKGHDYLWTTKLMQMSFNMIGSGNNNDKKKKNKKKDKNRNDSVASNSEDDSLRTVDEENTACNPLCTWFSRFCN